MEVLDLHGRAKCALGFAAALGCLTLAGCPSLQPFGCVGAAQCDLLDGPGTCLADGDCAYDDTACPSGLRRSPNAQIDPGECVSENPVETTSQTGSTTATLTTSTTGPLTSSTTSGPDPTTAASETCGLMSWYPDVDADGFGDANAEPVMACDQPEGTVQTADDCNDADPRVRPDHLDCEDNPTLAAWYRLDDPAGQAFLLDSGRDGLPGALNDATLGEPGQYGTAVRLAYDDEVSFHEAIAAFAPDGIPPTSGTVEFWAKLDPPDESCESACAQFALHISNGVGDGFGGNTPDLHVHVDHSDVGDPYFWFAIIDTSTGDPDTPEFVQSACRTEGPQVEIDRWTHVALRWSDSECAFLVDGLLADTDELGVINTGSDPEDLGWTSGRLGHPPGFEPRSFLGAIDEVMLFDESRTDAQIRADCGALPCPPT